VAHLLITGGAGFIGSHTCVALLSAGHRITIIEKFSNSSPKAIDRIHELSGSKSNGRIRVIHGDIRDHHDLHEAFSSHLDRPIDAVVHFAGLKAVGESVSQPLQYWDVNLAGTRSLLSSMQEHGCRCIVFSSSATIYGIPDYVPIKENSPISPINPYGYTKAAAEQLLADIAQSEPGWKIARLRYFNPVGAHPSGRIGEDPRGIPNNLFPFISQVSVGRREKLQIYGGDWPTADGTGVRDYIHVMDLAEGHQAALDHLLSHGPQLLTLNLGSGQGHSVLDVVKAFEQASGRTIPYDVVPRRPGDAAITVADPTLAWQTLGWRTQRSLNEICRDGWAWQQANPQGYAH
jgi:UDP-glucose 4-epimerase